MQTPLCLDECITSAQDARKALETAACRLVNIKVGRVGGHLEARRIHDVAASFSAPVWCGGMLESGVGRAHNIHLATLENFTKPGDTSCSSRYWARDIIHEPLETSGGMMPVPSRARHRRHAGPAVPGERHADEGGREPAAPSGGGNRGMIPPAALTIRELAGWPSWRSRRRWRGPSGARTISRKTPVCCWRCSTSAGWWPARWTGTGSSGRIWSACPPARQPPSTRTASACIRVAENSIWASGSSASSGRGVWSAASIRLTGPSIRCCWSTPTSTFTGWARRSAPSYPTTTAKWVESTRERPPTALKPNGTWRLSGRRRIWPGSRAKSGPNKPCTPFRTTCPTVARSAGRLRAGGLLPPAARGQ